MIHLMKLLILMIHLMKLLIPMIHLMKLLIPMMLVNYDRKNAIAHCKCSTDAYITAHSLPRGSFDFNHMI